MRHRTLRGWSVLVLLAANSTPGWSPSLTSFLLVAFRAKIFTPTASSSACSVRPGPLWSSQRTVNDAPLSSCAATVPWVRSDDGDLPVVALGFFGNSARKL